MKSAVNTNTQADTPIYLRARDRLIAQIEAGDLKPDDSLPSERVLAGELGISRMTARQAMVELEKAGYAYRRPRSGRFVADRRLSYDIGKTLSFATRALSESIDLSIEIVSKVTEPADQFIAEKLLLQPGELVHTYKRLFRVGGRTLLVESESAIAELFPDLLEQDLTQPSTLLHESRYGMIGSSGRVTLRCAEISSADMDLLDEESAPYGLEMDLVVLDSSGKPFCCGRQTWCNELAEFTLLTTPA